MLIDAKNVNQLTANVILYKWITKVACFVKNANETDELFCLLKFTSITKMMIELLNKSMIEVFLKHLTQPNRDKMQLLEKQ